jgi:hypothetical protein
VFLDHTPRPSVPLKKVTAESADGLITSAHLVGTVTSGDTASSAPVTMGETSTRWSGPHSRTPGPRTVAASTANDAGTFGSFTFMEVAVGHCPAETSLLMMMKPAEAGLPGESTSVSTPGGQTPVWLTVTGKGIPALFRKVTSG